LTAYLKKTSDQNYSIHVIIEKPYTLASDYDSDSSAISIKKEKHTKKEKPHSEDGKQSVKQGKKAIHPEQSRNDHRCAAEEPGSNSHSITQDEDSDSDTTGEKELYTGIKYPSYHNLILILTV
jgi:hypothetical protein